MPIEIKELHIRVAVDARAGEGAPGGVHAEKDGSGDTDAIVAECVEQVLEILQAKKER